MLISLFLSLFQISVYKHDSVALANIVSLVFYHNHMYELHKMQEEIGQNKQII